MSSRCRTCGGLIQAEKPIYPISTEMARLAPLGRVLMAAAGEYDQISEGEPTTASDFARWLDLEARHTLAYGDGSPISLRHDPEGRRVG